MKKLILILTVLLAYQSYAQTNSEIKKHFEEYYKQMKQQGDVQGVINAITHLNVLEPSVARKDTLAFIYASEGRYIEAINTVGVEKLATDSDMNVEVKAISLKALNQPKMALEQYEILYKRQPDPNVAYELAELKLQLQDVPGAKTQIEYGLANAKDDMKRAFYETQQPYQTSLKSAFLYLKALAVFQENKDENTEQALVLLNRALASDPNFNLAKITKEALLTRKKE